MFGFDKQLNLTKRVIGWFGLNIPSAKAEGSSLHYDDDAVDEMVESDSSDLNNEDIE